jgi:hypothetical protein
VQSLPYQNRILPKLITGALMITKRRTALDGRWFYSSQQLVQGLNQVTKSVSADVVFKILKSMVLS